MLELLVPDYGLTATAPSAHFCRQMYAEYVVSQQLRAHRVHLREANRITRNPPPGIRKLETGSVNQGLPRPPYLPCKNGEYRVETLFTVINMDHYHDTSQHGA